ncbi:helix-turn-helix domain-containing protein [Devosia sp.]|uniref:helix-turn-helix domain-containing protein n=1 Tax=Devosia sp. TaxID=1871048 RepID=UPI003F70AD2E
MRAPIGLKISSRRRALGVSQAALARRAGISASYLNLIERNKRHVGGSLLIRLAEELGVELAELSGDSEHRLIAELDEAFADPVLAGVDMPASRDLVAQQPAAAQAIARLRRAYLGATANADLYADRLRTDPLLAQLLHRILSGITAVRSTAEILEDVTDLDEGERSRFVETITRETRGLTEVARGLIGQFEVDARGRRTLSPIRELDDLIFERDNYFPALEAAAKELRAEIEAIGPFGEAALAAGLAAKFGVGMARSAGREVDAAGFPGQYHFNSATRTMWFQVSAGAATRQFQLTRLYAELSAADAIEREVDTPQLSSGTARRLGYRALSSYLAGAVVFPYGQFLADAEAQRYDIEALRQIYSASFEQVAHRLVSLRKPDDPGLPFGFLRSDAAGRLTKHFPLPGLPLPSAGHACPRWVIYGAFRTPRTLTRQIAQFADGSRYLFIASAQARSGTGFADHAIPTSVMLACDVLHADRTVYGAGLDLGDGSTDVPVGPSCRLCPRRDCADRQEEAFTPAGEPTAVRAPLVPRRFDVGEPG